MSSCSRSMGSWTDLPEPTWLPNEAEPPLPTPGSAATRPRPPVSSPLPLAGADAMMPRSPWRPLPAERGWSGRTKKHCCCKASPSRAAPSRPPFSTLAPRPLVRSSGSTSLPVASPAGNTAAEGDGPASAPPPDIAVGTEAAATKEGDRPAFPPLSGTADGPEAGTRTGDVGEFAETPAPAISSSSLGTERWCCCLVPPLPPEPRCLPQPPPPLSLCCCPPLPPPPPPPRCQPRPLPPPSKNSRSSARLLQRKAS